MRSLPLSGTRGTRCPSRLIVLVGMLCLLLVLSSCLGTSPSPPSLQGTDLGSTPALTFQLVDQTGATISLLRSKDIRWC